MCMVGLNLSLYPSFSSATGSSPSGLGFRKTREITSPSLMGTGLICFELISVNTSFAAVPSIPDRLLSVNIPVT